MNTAGELFFTKEHEWIEIKGKLGKVGITDFALNLLGDIAIIKLPKNGEICNQFEQFAVVESVKAAIGISAPMSGKITQVNTEIEDRPELVNRSPEKEAWFVVIEIKDENEKHNLLTSSAYERYLEESCR